MELYKRWLLGEWSQDTSSTKWKGLLQRCEVLLVLEFLLRAHQVLFG